MHLLLVIWWLNLIQSTVYYFNSLQLLRIPYTVLYKPITRHTVLSVKELITEYTVTSYQWWFRIYCWGLYQSYLVYEYRQMYSTLLLPIVLVYYRLTTSEQLSRITLSHLSANDTDIVEQRLVTFITQATNEWAYTLLCYY